MLLTMYQIPASAHEKFRSASNAKLALEAMRPSIPKEDKGHKTTRLNKQISRYWRPRRRNSRNCHT